MAIETIRYYDDFEERTKIYYAVFSEDGVMVYLVGGQGWLVPAERIIQDVIDSDKDNMWDEQAQEYVVTPKYEAKDLTCVLITDNALGDDWTHNHTYKGKDYRELMNSLPKVSERLKGKPIKALNKKDKEGIPENYNKEVTIAKTKIKKPVKAKERGVALQNIFKGKVLRIDATKPKQQLIQEVHENPSCRLQIVAKGTFDSAQKGREIYLVRYDGKLVGRHFPDENDTEFECTWYDFCRGEHLYQLQFESPIDGDYINEPSLIMEETTNYHKPRKTIGRIDV